MKILEPIVQSKGFVFEIVERTEFHAIQSQKDQQSGKLIAYEVFRINKNKEREIQGVKIPASESRPSDNQFGVSAWTYGVFGSDGSEAFEKAKDRFENLEQAQKERSALTQQHESKSN